MGAPHGRSDEGVETALAEAIKAAPVRIVSAYLFGSRAEGRSHAESDVDVGIVLPHEPPTTDAERFDLRVRITSWLIGQLHRNDLDVVILNDAPPLLGRRVVTKGRRLVCNDAAADHAFVRDVQLRAADLEPFLRRTRRVKLAAIARSPTSSSGSPSSAVTSTTFGSYARGLRVRTPSNKTFRSTTTCSSRC